MAKRKRPNSPSESATLRAPIADPVVVNGAVEFTAALTACLAIRCMELTVPMGAWPIGVRTPTAMTIMAGVK